MLARSRARILAGEGRTDPHQAVRDEGMTAPDTNPSATATRPRASAATRWWSPRWGSPASCPATVRAARGRAGGPLGPAAGALDHRHLPRPGRRRARRRGHGRLGEHPPARRRGVPACHRWHTVHSRRPVDRAVDRLARAGAAGARQQPDGCRPDRRRPFRRPSPRRPAVLAGPGRPVPGRRGLVRGERGTDRHRFAPANARGRHRRAPAHGQTPGSPARRKPPPRDRGAHHRTGEAGAEAATGGRGGLGPRSSRGWDGSVGTGCYGRWRS